MGHFRRACLAFAGAALVVLLPGCGDEEGPTRVGPDTTSPARVTDLTAVAQTSSSVTLQWTAPGDDARVGQAAEYDLRYRDAPLSEDAWDDATRVDSLPSPGLPGSQETFTVQGLEITGVVYFALTTADEAANWSPLSNTASTGAPSLYLITPDGTGTFPTIQDAINAASEGDVIELDDGTFTGEGNRDVDFLGKAVTVRSRSGDPEACLIRCGGSETEPHRGFIFQSGEHGSSVLEGVKIVGAYAPLDTCVWGGGGILCRQASPVLSNLVLRLNAAQGRGGGLHCYEASPMLTDVTFFQNSARSGGGMSCVDGSPALNRVTFQWNWATSVGGGCEIDGGSPTLSEVVFTENEAPYGGGLSCRTASPTLQGASFAGNIATYCGGGLSCDLESSPVIHDVLFADNTASWGGAVYGDRSTLAMSVVTFCGNRGISGAALYALTTSGEADQVTFSGNVGISAVAAVSGSFLTLRNSILAFTVDGQSIAVLARSGVGLVCCDLYGNEGGDWVGEIAGQLGTDGNISEDPLFCDAEGGDFHLQDGSPCAGNGECERMGAWPVGCEGAKGR